ncbi:MAG: ABC transporter permease [Chloroflexi bacterium]|nr:MAG: ABC transporter permease [Chloroflexota bacterium]
MAPTLIALLILSVYPITYNVYMSTQNKNTFRPRANCVGEEVNGVVPSGFEKALVNMMEPTCWSVFQQTAVQGRGGFYVTAGPALANYQRLYGDLFSFESLKSTLMIFAMFIPLVVVYLGRKQVNKSLSPPQTWWWWIVAFVVVYVLWVLLGGAKYFDQLMTTGDFFIVTFRTIIYVIACIPLFFVVGLMYALILNNPDIKGLSIWRLLLILPWAVQSYIAALVWQFFFRGEVGTINQVLDLINICTRGASCPTWLGDPTKPYLAFFAVVVINLWMSYPFFTVIILGALQSIPADQYEAADVDGATWWEKLTLITIPLIRPAVLPAVVLSSITTFQMFNTVWLVTQGGPSSGADVPGYTEFVMLYAYDLFQSQNAGIMGAFAVIVFVMLFLATLYSLRFTRITKGAYE